MTSIDEAARRLDAALAFLEAAVVRRVEADRTPSERETELALMERDRARLAAELDAACARLARAEAVAGDVGRRLDRAIDVVEDALAGTDASASPAAG